jgi:hypothetical protein
MARHGTVRRNLRRNIRSWSEEEATRFRGDRATAAKVIAVFVALSLAGAFIPLAVNLVFRIPDLYSFDLGRTQALADTGANVTADKVADAVSSFMRHKTDQLQVTADPVKDPATGEVMAEEGDPITLFTAGDGAVMKTLRSFLDNILVIGLTSLVLFVALCAMLTRWRRPRELKRGFIGGFVLYGAVICFTALTIVFDLPAKAKAVEVMGARFAQEDAMPKLFHDGFFFTSWIAVTVITLVIMLLLLSVMSRLTKSEMMFINKN